MGARPRRHRVVGHTADVGLEASAPDLPALFEEAASALAGIAADVGSAPAAEPHRIELDADDLDALAYAWLNELIGLAQARGKALALAKVDRVVETPDHRWLLSGTATFVPFAPAGSGGSGGARARLDLKSATYHRMAVRRETDGWTMTAYLDV